MSHLTAADAGAWGSASYLADLCELNARWLERDGIRFRPFGQSVPDMELAPVIPVLAGLNRAGFLTVHMQDAEQTDLDEGGEWLQCAAVAGHVGDARTVRRIEAAAADARLIAIVHEPPPRFAFCRNDAVQCVTWEDGTGEDFLGSRLSRRYLRSRWDGFGFCGKSAQDAVCASWQVAVIDPEPGREHHLWNSLSRALLGTRTDIA